MKKKNSAPAQKKTASIYPLAFTKFGKRIIGNRSAKIHIGKDFDLIRKQQPATKEITKESVEAAIQEIENILDAVHSNFIQHSCNDIFQIIELDKRIRNFADREKRESLKLFNEELINC